MRSQHGTDQRCAQPGVDVTGRDIARGQRIERVFEAAQLRFGTGQAMYAPAAILMPVFSDIGQQGKVTERPHHTQRLLDGQPVELMVQRVLLRNTIGVTRIATLGDRELSNVLDAVEDNFAIGNPYDVAKQSTEELDFLPEAGIFFVLCHGGLTPCNGES